MTKKSSSLVYVVDDDSSIRKSLERLIRSVGYQARTFSSAGEFLQLEKIDGPSCLVLDIRMPGLSGTDLQAELSRRNLWIPTIFITGHGDIKTSVQAMKNGAVDFLPKPYDQGELLEAIERALEKDRRHRKVDQEQKRITGLIDCLTPAEQNVLRWVITGNLNKQIAFKLGITEKTVKVHRGRVMKKLKANSVADLVRLTQQISLEPAQG